MTRSIERRTQPHSPKSARGRITRVHGRQGRGCQSQKWLSAAFIAALSSAPLVAQGAAPAAQPVQSAQVSARDSSRGAEPVTLELIMSNPEWIARSPEDPYWGWDSRTVYYSRSRPSENGIDPRVMDLYRHPLDGTATLIGIDQVGSEDAARFVVNTARTQRAFGRDGDLFIRSLETGRLRQLTRTAASENRPFFLADGRLGFYRDSGAVFARDLVTGLEEQLFDLSTEQEPEDKRAEARKKESYVDQQEERLIRWLSDEDKRADLSRSEEKLRDRDPSRPDAPWFLGDKVRLAGLGVSPDGRFALAALADKGKPPERGQMAALVAASGDVEMRPVRPKVATVPESDQRLFLLDRVTRTQTRIDLSELPGRRDDPLADLRAAAKAAASKTSGEGSEPTADDDSEAALTEPLSDVEEAEKGQISDEDQNRGAELNTVEMDTGEANDGRDRKSDGDLASGDAKEKAKKKAPRPVTLTQPIWSEAGDFAIVQAFSHDNKDRWVIRVSWSKPAVGGDAKPELETRVLHHQHDPAWINWSFRDVGIVPQSSLVFFLSEASGYSHLYLIDGASGAKSAARMLTSGDFVVDAPAADSKGRFLYFTAADEHPGRTEVQRIALSTLAPEGTAKREKVTALGGLNDFLLSPDGTKLLITHSEITSPPELTVQATTPGAQAKRLTRTISEEFRAVDWVVPQIVEVPSTHHDRAITSRLYTPTKDSGDLRPAVLFVHGAGYLQNAHYGWSGYFREFMFHTFLVRQGYVVLDMDYRASKGYGRDWRTAIYRQMGTPEVEDLEDGVRYLTENFQVDPQRVGVYGGSYGGFLTFMAMFNEPDLFAAGAALRPVTDWAHYNHGYTSNILNTPDIDPEAYRRSSPIEFAEGLSKPLLIASGMLDDNVFFQDSVRLVQRLIELEKQDWELAVYPVESHGFREPSSWLDEYRRIFKLFEENLKPVGGR